MSVVKMAEAVVYFRALRAIGYFSESKRPGKFYFTLSHRPSSPYLERVPNGLPSALLELSPDEIFATLGEEIQELCEFHNFQGY